MAAKRHRGQCHFCQRWCVYFTKTERVCRSCGRVDPRIYRRGIKQGSRQVMLRKKKKRIRGQAHSVNRKRILSPAIENLLSKGLV